MEISETDFLILIQNDQNDQTSYVKHVLGAFYVLFTIFRCVCVGGGGGLPRGLGHFSSPNSSKMEISETSFFDTVTMQDYQISYVKHV